jgi:hypothetical protein
MVHGIPINSASFRQDGAKPLASNAVRRFLHDVFTERVSFNRYRALLLEGFSWPPTSRDLNPSDYFVCGYLNDSVFQKNLYTIPEVKTAIQSEIYDISTTIRTKVLKKI